MQQNVGPMLESNDLNEEDFFLIPYLPKEKELDQKVYHLEPEGTIENSIKIPNMEPEGTIENSIKIPNMEPEGTIENSIKIPNICSSG